MGKCNRAWSIQEKGEKSKCLFRFGGVAHKLCRTGAGVEAYWAGAEKAMADDLRESNLTVADAKKRGYKLLTPEQTRERTKTNKYPGAYVWSHLIPYFDIHRKRVTDYWRVRYLEEVTGPFGSKPKKPRRYSGPKGARLRIYFDPTVDYSPVLGDEQWAR